MVRIYQLAGPAVTFWTSRYPATMASTTVYLPGRRVQDDAGVSVLSTSTRVRACCIASLIAK